MVKVYGFRIDMDHSNNELFYLLQVFGESFVRELDWIVTLLFPPLNKFKSENVDEFGRVKMSGTNLMVISKNRYAVEPPETGVFIGYPKDVKEKDNVFQVALSNLHHMQSDLSVIEFRAIQNKYWYIFTTIESIYISFKKNFDSFVILEDVY